MKNIFQKTSASLLSLGTIALLANVAPANAATIEGGHAGSDGVEAVTEGMVGLVDLSFIDFGDIDAGTPGDQFLFTAGTGEFGAGGMFPIPIPSVGTIADSLTVDPFTAVNDFLVWEVGSESFSFDLTSIVVETGTADSVVLFGEGDFSSTDPNVDDAGAEFRLTAQRIGQDISYSFSWATPSLDTPEPMGTPEPGTILGLIAFGGAGLLARRRQK